MRAARVRRQARALSRGPARAPVRFVPARLAALGRPASDTRRLAVVRAALRARFPQVDRVAVALYDAATGTARTFAARETRRTGLSFYEAPLRDAPSLLRVRRSGRVRVVDDLAVFGRGRSRHQRALRAAGWRSSATFPVSMDGRFAAFVFLDSRRPAAFPDRDLPLLEVFARLAAHEATAGLREAAALRAALRTAVAFVHARDPETGGHLERMARYARLIAQDLARSGRRGLDDERVRWIEEFAPLHDVGKLGIPDRILLKGGPLTPAERRVMETHTRKGRRVVDAILRRFAAAPGRGRALREIAEHHHEAMDGSGYPHGLCGRRIPLEARITAVADVFDALSSARSYKDAWPVGRALAALRRLAGGKLDRDCVRALLRNRRQVELIRRRFSRAGRLPLRRTRAFSPPASPRTSPPPGARPAPALPAPRRGASRRGPPRRGSRSAAPRPLSG